MTPQCGMSVVQILAVRVDIGVVTYEDMTPQCGRSVVQVLVVRVDIGVVIYEAMTPQCGRSVVQVLVVRVDIGVVIYEAMVGHCRTLFENMQNSEHRLNHLLPVARNNDYNLRRILKYELPKCSTNRYKNTFVPYCLYNFQK